MLCCKAKLSVFAQTKWQFQTNNCVCLWLPQCVLAGQPKMWKCLHGFIRHSKHAKLTCLFPLWLTGSAVDVRQASLELSCHSQCCTWQQFQSAPGLDLEHAAGVTVGAICHSWLKVLYTKQFYHKEPTECSSTAQQISWLHWKVGFWWPYRWVSELRASVTYSPNNSAQSCCKAHKK